MPKPKCHNSKTNVRVLLSIWILIPGFLFCFFIPGCVFVSEQWVRGYVQHEMAGVKDMVAEEVYPTEKAILDIKTQMATLSVELKNIKDGLRGLKETIQGGSLKSEEMGKKVAELNKELTSLQEKVEDLTGDLKKLHLDLNQIQTGMEAISKKQESTLAETITEPETSTEETKVLKKGDRNDK